MAAGPDVEFAIHRGWALIPLHGKIPTREAKGWRTWPATSLEQAQRWAAAGNVGVRTGPASGIFVIDVDRGKGADEGPLNLPETLTSETGGGGRHYVFRNPDGVHLGNTAGRLGPHIDTRGDGGYIVLPGSSHPETGKVYCWLNNLEPAELPEHIIARLTQRPVGVAAPPKRTSYARAALESEIQAVVNAPAHTGNDVLNIAAFNLGQLVGGGQLDEREVLEALVQASVPRRPEAEARGTILSGMSKGMAQPRRPRGRPASSRVPMQSAVTRVKGDERPLVLIPGPHQPEDADPVMVGNHDFVASVMKALPPGVLYLRSEVIGELAGPCGQMEFRPMTASRSRAVIDAQAILYRWHLSRGKNSIPERVYVPCTEDMAKVVLKSATSYGEIRGLQMLVNYPIFTSGFMQAAPGWNAAAGLFYDQPTSLEGLQPITDECEIHRILSDLIVDFPFDSDASRHNYFGLLLTPIVRPALRGQVPLHLIDSSIERAGKSKLVEQVLGRTVLGRSVAASQLSDNEEERKKAILSLLLMGRTVVHLDNINTYLDSGALASLITAPSCSGRVLGHSQDVEAANTLTVVGTGNKVRMSSELAKRTVPIMLRPSTDHPELRTDFVHLDLDAYLADNRVRILGALVGMVERWRRAGCPRFTDRPMGGFEDWAGCVGGILAYNGFIQWRVSDKRWQAQANTEQTELETFITAWKAKLDHPDDTKPAKWLYDLAEELELFGKFRRAPSEQGRLVSFSTNVLSRHVDRPICGFFITTSKYGNATRWGLSDHPQPVPSVES